MTRAASLVVAALLLSSAAVLALARALPESVASAVDAGALVVFGGGALLALLVRRGRLALGLIVLALSDRAVVHLDSRAIFDAVAVLLPLNLAVIAWLDEASLHTTRGASRLALIVLEAGVVALLQLAPFSTLDAWLERPLAPIDLRDWIAVPQLGLLGFALAFGVVLTRFLLDRRPFAAGAGWALAASFLALDGASAGNPVSVHFATAGLLLLVGASWERPRGARVDDITALPGSLGLHKALERLPRRYVLASVEIDEFGAFRDEHGPDAARRMLRRVADDLRRVGGGGRAFYRGGHTFAVVFSRLSLAAAAAHIEAVRRRIEAAAIDVRLPERPRAGGPEVRGGRPAAMVERTVSVTVSAGLAEAPRRGVDPHEVLRAADAALGRAKEAGQNRVAV